MQRGKDGIGAGEDIEPRQRREFDPNGASVEVVADSGSCLAMPAAIRLLRYRCAWLGDNGSGALRHS